MIVPVRNSSWWCLLYKSSVTRVSPAELARCTLGDNRPFWTSFCPVRGGKSVQKLTRCDFEYCGILNRLIKLLPTTAGPRASISTLSLNKPTCIHPVGYSAIITSWEYRLCFPRRRTRGHHTSGCQLRLPWRCPMARPAT